MTIARRWWPRLRRIVRDAARCKGLTNKPRTQPPHEPAPSRDIPRAVRREVWQRDQGRCQWPTKDGGICGSTNRVQFHHIVDRARGGPHTVENIMLACGAHNQHAADLVWGRAWMEKCRRRGQCSMESSVGRPSVTEAHDPMDV